MAKIKNNLHLSLSLFFVVVFYLNIVFYDTMYLIFDTETTGMTKRRDAPISDTDSWPRMVQLAWQLHDARGKLIEHASFIIQPEGFEIPHDTERVHGISTELALKDGRPLQEVLTLFNEVLSKATFIVGHNLNFDIGVLGCEFYRNSTHTALLDTPHLDTCTEATAAVCKIPNKSGSRYKYPTLSELYRHLFGLFFTQAHNATADVEATARCFFELVRRELFTLAELRQEANYFTVFQQENPQLIAPVGLQHVDLKKESAKLRPQGKRIELSHTEKEKNRQRLANIPFSHLHNHSQFTVLQSTINIPTLVQTAAQYNMPAVALTDTGNMMGALQFEHEVSKYNAKIRQQKKEAEQAGKSFDKQELKPIIGCELNVCEDLRQRGQKDNGFQVVLLAKNQKGYQNLIKLASIAHTEGFYYVPRIDKAEIQKYKEGLIVLTGGYLMGEIPKRLLSTGQKKAEEALLWWKEQFGDDLYIEINRHGLEQDEHINDILIEFSLRHEIPLVATNNTFYIDANEASAQDVLVCVKESELVSTPKSQKKSDSVRLEGNQYYFRTSEQMRELFIDLPQALESVVEIVDKCEIYPLDRPVLLPKFDIPKEFQDPLDEEDGGKRGENNYLRHLTYQGAIERYGEITDSIRERIDFELHTIEKTGYPGYFLIVQDFCTAARQMGVWVGPGRGSAAGSAVAYCNGITNVDPIKYDLLFERFLNPDRISLPDIDIDFDDEGRNRVLDWVIQKYGANQVAQIITYGTMAAKSSIRDTARVMNLPLNEANTLSKLVPDNVSLSTVFSSNDKELAQALKNNQQVEKAKELKQLISGSDLRASVLQQALKLEGSVRNTGTHACGVIITPEDITNFVPVSLVKDSTMWCTQFDNSVVESAGLLKMDFLGLSTLTILKNALKNIRLRHHIDIDIDSIPLDDVKTYELFQRGETVGIFQFESEGMQKYMRDLQPSVFSDLIALNALYRPGPMDYIPSYIRRKHGEEPITYDLVDCQQYLEETYGITVYQEQVMLLSQKLANFTKGEADTLRKAMGKKQKNVLDKMKPLFLQNGVQNGHPKLILEKIWKDWEAFASYAFNKSHATCYAWIGYQTAYLKANYPAEYMAAVLSNNMRNIQQVAFFMEECKRMGIPVLGPDINESLAVFTVNSSGAIRFGLEGIKGLGSAPSEAIISERENGGIYTSIFNFAERLGAKKCNKRAYESLAYGGGFDSFTDIHRAQYFAESGSNKTFIDNLIRFGTKSKETEDSGQLSLFGDDPASALPPPTVPICERWTSWETLKKEKEVVGIYISGHPLDEYRLELKWLCNAKVDILSSLEQHIGKDLTIGCIITEVELRTTVRGASFASIIIEDYTHSNKLLLWDSTYTQFKHLLVPNTFVAIRGRIEIPPRSNRVEFTIRSIEQLAVLREQKMRSIRLKLPAKSVTSDMIASLNRLFLENEGQCSVNFTIFDTDSKHQANLHAKSMHIQLNNTVIETLDKMHITYEI